jgi:acetyltransferase
MFMLRHGSNPKIYPVNPKRDTVQGIPCYRSVSSLPEAPDVGMVIVSKKLVPGVLKDLGEIGCSFAIITGSGYAETGSKGRQEQDELLEISSKYGIRLMGPNCLGLVSLHGPAILSWCATLERERNELLQGDVGMISQSGALLGSIWDLAIGRQLHFSHLLSTGNEADLDISDYISYFAADNRTKVITCFIEGLRKPEAFLHSITECHQNNKPVIVYKVGRTTESARAAESHTGALTGSDDTFDAICRKYGIIRMDTLDGLISAALALRTMPPPKGDRIGVFSCSGGAAGLISDRLGTFRLRMAEVDDSFENAMTNILGWGPPHNPADIAKGPLKSFDIIADAINRFYLEDKFDMVIILMTMMYFQKVAPDLMLKGLPNKLNKPVLACWIGDKVAVEPAEKMRKGGVPTFHDVESLLNAADALCNWGRYLHRTTKTELLTSPDQGSRDEASVLLRHCAGKPNEWISKQIISQYGIPVPQGRIVSSVKEAQDLAENIGYPVVVKGLSPTILHKTESGLVCANLMNKDMLEQATKKIDDIFSTKLPNHVFQGFLVEKQLPPPIAETFIGCVYDNIGFHKLLFGVGGIFIEVLKDTSTRLVPVSIDDAVEMISEIKALPILTGARGSSQADIEALANVISSVSRLVSDFKDEIIELDINPLFAYSGSVMAVDALIRLKEVSEI